MDKQNTGQDVSDSPQREQDKWKVDGHASHPDGPLTEEVSVRMLQVIRNQLFGKARVRRMMRYTSMAAAIVLGVIAGLWWLLPDHKTVQGPLVAASERPGVFVNDGPSPKNIRLQDGTQVTLYPGSQLTMDSAFNTSSRKTFLSGEADFEVVHDVHKPFYVVSGEFITTDLGTSFKIIHRPEQRRFSVKLVSGSIKIERKNADNTYRLLGLLRPSETLAMDPVSGVMHLQSPATTVVKESVPVGKPRAVPKRILPAASLGVEKISLPDFLDQLQQRFESTIEFNREELANIYVTAVFKEESLQNILEQLALLNDLSLKVTSKGYTIGKQ